MIAALRGTVAEKNLNEAVIDAGGVGYRVSFSLLTLARLPDEGQPVSVRVRTVVREDAFELFGFLSAAEEEMFLLLTSVSHVGPKMAVGILSGLEVDALARALAQGEVAKLTAIRGVGKKTAERLVLELREKAKALIRPVVTSSSVTGSAVEIADRSDLISALVNLGYKQQQAEKAVDQARDHAGEDAAFEVLFRESLKGLGSAAINAAR